MERYNSDSEQFKAIFAQRGKAVGVKEMAKGSFYISDATVTDWSCIFEFLGNEYFDETTITVGQLLVENGAYCGCADIDAVTVYEATEDQIELLNAYKL